MNTEYIKGFIWVIIYPMGSLDHLNISMKIIVDERNVTQVSPQ